MPYLTNANKKEVDKGTFHTAGDLNYHISTIIGEYLLTNNVSYQTMNDVVGALESAKMEFYRRIVTPYEDLKIMQNGDITPYNQLADFIDALIKGNTKTSSTIKEGEYA